MKNTPETDLRTALERQGAREFEMVALMMDPTRGLAALNVALAKGVDRPIPYAIKLFDSPDWYPSGAKRRMETNQVVEKTCTHCDGDRFVLVTDGRKMYEETYAPCRVCNASANTERWLVNEKRETRPQ